MPRVTVMKEVSEALGGFHLPRESLLAVLTRLRDQLENHYDHYRGRRDPEDPDLFDYVLYLAEADGTWHTLRLSVDDVMATGYLFVVAVSHRTGKGTI